MVGGIYCITNLANNKKYIGQTNNFRKRKQDHFSRLRYGTHYNEHIQRAYDKYGKENFKFSILKKCSAQERDFFERHYIKKYNTLDINFGYNLESGGSANKIVAEETKKKISEFRKGYEIPEETRKKISKRRIELGVAAGENNPMYGVHLNGEKNGMFGRTHTKESREKMSNNLSKVINKSSYYRVTIHKSKKVKQGFDYRYRWYGDDGKRHELCSVDINVLEKKVKSKGLKWEKYGDKINESAQIIEDIKVKHQKYREEKLKNKKPRKVRNMTKEEILRHSINLSKANNKTGYFRVSKTKSKKHKQGFRYIYQYGVNGKRYSIAAMDLNSLERKVKEKNWLWINLNEVTDEELEQIIKNNTNL